MTTTTTPGIAATTPDRQAEDRVDAASRTLHTAEGQLHPAHTSGIDAWITAAGDTLHRALEEYLAAPARDRHAPMSAATARRPADCTDSGHERGEWTVLVDDEQIEWRHCEHCGNLIEERRTAIGRTAS